MNVYDISSIIEINKDGLIFLGTDGNKHSINFHECRSNWVKHVNESGSYITWSGERINNLNDTDTTCIGQRDWFSEKPYFEFFTNPLIRFEIQPKRRLLDIFAKHWKQRYYPQFYNIQKKIENAGWCTFDLG
ncbi:MAG: hypothetical protein N3B21_18200 [Clostridia bacterium]|nr:hypothetical protein [Clostridia bacterium]